MSHSDPPGVPARYVPDVRLHHISLMSLLLLAVPALAGVEDSPEAALDGWIRLGGKRLAVHWSDGDSFQFRSGPRKGKETRLIGFNTLESYGPVHRWGDWTGEELWALSKRAGRFAAKREWECSTTGKRDAYDRLLVECTDLRRHLLRRGLAHIYAYDDPADPTELDIQKKARMDEVGMWARGRPETIVTSVHSAGSGSSGKMRIVHARTGETEMVGHRTELQICDELCHGDKWTGSCMLFVPYKLRYLDKKPDCIAGLPPAD